MATQIQFRRGTKTQHVSFTGATAEVTVNTTDKSLHVHDGTTQGGFELARANLSNHNGVGVLTATTFSGNLKIDAGDIQSGILTTNSTNQAVVMSISASTFRSVQYQVQVTQGTNYNMTSINVLHDDTTTYMTEYGTINQPTGIATFSSDISGGSLRLLGFPASSSSTTFKIIRTAINS